MTVVQSAICIDSSGKDVSNWIPLSRDTNKKNLKEAILCSNNIGNPINSKRFKN